MVEVRESAVAGNLTRKNIIQLHLQEILYDYHNEDQFTLCFFFWMNDTVKLPIFFKTCPVKKILLFFL